MDSRILHSPDDWGICLSSDKHGPVSDGPCSILSFLQDFWCPPGILSDQPVIVSAFLFTLHSPSTVHPLHSFLTTILPTLLAISSITWSIQLRGRQPIGTGVPQKAASMQMPHPLVPRYDEDWGRQWQSVRILLNYTEEERAHNFIHGNKLMPIMLIIVDLAWPLKARPALHSSFCHCKPTQLSLPNMPSWYLGCL
jgi:hypothetical protein